MLSTSLRRYSGISKCLNIRNIGILSHPREFVDAIDVFIFDCDGVVWRGDKSVLKAKETLNNLRARGKKLFFITNSTQSRQSLLSKFTRFEIEVRLEEILSASFAAATYLKKNLPPGRIAYVLGEAGIAEELRLQGVPTLGSDEDSGKCLPLRNDHEIAVDPLVGAVVVGFDPAINYYKIQYSQLCLNTIPDCLFVATNLDATSHQTNHQEWADAGSMVGAVRGCTGREPIVVGKPSSILVDFVVQQHHVDRQRMCMVGDRLDTDIAFGVSNKMRTLLALSGVTTLSRLQCMDEGAARPCHYIHSIADLHVD